MIYIAVGGFGFIVVHLFDLVCMKRIAAGVKPATWIIGSGLLIYALAMLWIRSDALPLPLWLTWLGWVLLSLSLLMLLYSLFVNLPFRKTYISAGISDRLITTGLYSLVRHPGVLWFTLFMLSLVLASKSTLLLIAAPIFILLDVVLVIVQDRILFVRMFTGYKAYQQSTPMLIPNRQSINAFINSLRQSRV